MLSDSFMLAEEMYNNCKKQSKWDNGKGIIYSNSNSVMSVENRRTKFSILFFVFRQQNKNNGFRLQNEKKYVSDTLYLHTAN